MPYLAWIRLPGCACGYSLRMLALLNAVSPDTGDQIPVIVDDSPVTVTSVAISRGESEGADRALKAHVTIDVTSVEPFAEPQYFEVRLWVFTDAQPEGSEIASPAKHVPTMIEYTSLNHPGDVLPEAWDLQTNSEGEGDVRAVLVRTSLQPLGD